MPQTPIPLYQHLADILLTGIRSGEYSPGTRIPSEHALADGCIVVRQAIEVLVKRQFPTRRAAPGPSSASPGKI